MPDERADFSANYGQIFEHVNTLTQIIMHDPTDPFNAENFDINLSEISKIEGAASLEIKVRNKKIEYLKFSISEWKRFYTQAIQGKPAVAVPQLVARICGTCSNAHLLCSLKAIENAFSVMPSNQTKQLRKLLYFGLIIRDHALHLYIFSLPDIYGKNSILDFDENDPVQKQLLDDAFAVKEVGNQLSIRVGGRSVHAPFPTIGGFLKLPKLEELKEMIIKLSHIRERIIRLIDIFQKTPDTLAPKDHIEFSGLSSADFSFLQGAMKNSSALPIEENTFGDHLDKFVIPYSHARGFKFKGNLMMVGALARLNLSKNSLHAKTKVTAANALAIFPSANLFHNNLAQAVEILHAVDLASDLIESLSSLNQEPLLQIKAVESTGVGVIEAPRGTLYHKYEIGAD